MADGEFSIEPSPEIIGPDLPDPVEALARLQGRRAALTIEDIRRGSMEADDRSIGYARATGGYAHLSDGSWWVNGQRYRPGTFDRLFNRSQ